MNRQAPFPQAIRPLGLPTGQTSRPPNRGWGAPPPGVPTPQSRGSANLASFAQSVGGMSQPATPLDMSEFPALGGGVQSQNAHVWNRIQSPNQGRPSEDPFQSHHGMDDYRLGGQPQPSQAQQMQGSGAIDDFPALPRTSANGHMDMNGNQAQQRAGLGFLNLGSLGVNQNQQQVQQQQHRQQSQLQAQQAQKRQQMMDVGSLGNVGRPNVVSPPTVPNGIRVAQQSRILPIEMQQPQQQQQNPLHMMEQDKKVMKPAPGIGAPGMNGHTLPIGAPGLHPTQTQSSLSQSLQPQNQQSLQQQQQQLQNASDGQGSLLGLSEADKYGLPGLIATIRSDRPEISALGFGSDLTQLGLDLSSSENLPLFPSFTSTWLDNDLRGVEPEFNIPSCYHVASVPPLASRVSNFVDETLFYIFYTMPGDIMQEIVASELTARNWRYHTGLRLWLTKDPASQPQQINDTSEKGVYIIFDPNTWQRLKRDMILDYHFLDQRTIGKA